MHIIIECCDRQISKLKLAKSSAESIALANQMLEDHLEDIGYARDTPNSDELQRCSLENNEDSAWCNLKDIHFDVFRIALNPDTENAALEILLKARCHHIINSPGSNCGDGTCDECAIDRLLGELRK